MIRLLALLALLGLAPQPLRAEELTRRATWDAQAALELSLRLELGLGMAADARAAMTHLCRAAALGSQPAAQHLAAGLLMPDEPGYDPAAAAAWLRHAQMRARSAESRPPPCPDGSGPPDGGSPLAGLVAELALERALDPLLVKAIIAVESAWRTEAVSPAGAQGLMQLMPRTGRQHGVTDAFDVGQNLRGGMDHFAGLLRSFGGDEALALAAYNAGEGRVRACRCVPDISETTQYVRRVLALASRPAPARGAPASRRTSGGTGRAPGPPG